MDLFVVYTMVVLKYIMYPLFAPLTQANEVRQPLKSEVNLTLCFLAANIAGNL